MHIVIIGAGPVGLFCGLSLARRGQGVTVVDRDPGPPATGAWERRSVMQFRHPHYFRPIVCQALLEWLPDLWQAVVSAGAVPGKAEGWPEHIYGLNCRRETFERAIWSVARTEPRLTFRNGFAQQIVTNGERVTGVTVDGSVIEADVVIAAAGRSSHLGDEYRAPADGGPCGHAYITRMYRAREGIAPPPSSRPILECYAGYLAALFPQDDRTFSTLIHVPAGDTGLGTLCQESRWDLAVGHVPLLAPWTDHNQFEPITDVMRGGLLTNTYRGQLDSEGKIAVAGLLFVGDAVSTTNPHRGRGVSLGLQQAAELVRLLEHDGRDCAGVARQFEVWCAENIRPWFEDQVQSDAALLTRFRGDDIEVDSPLASDVICAAVDVDPSVGTVVGPYLAMLRPPASLGVLEERVRNLLRTGWRPAFASGPSRDELLNLVDPSKPTEVAVGA